MSGENYIKNLLIEIDKDFELLRRAEITLEPHSKQYKEILAKEIALLTEKQQLLKHIELIRTATGEGLNIVGNALKTIYTRIEGVDEVSKMLKENGIEVEDKTVNDLLNSLAQKWSQFDLDKKWEISKGIAGMYQARRFNVLMDGLSSNN